MFIAPNLAGPLPFERLPKRPQNAAASKRNQIEAANQQAWDHKERSNDVAVLAVRQEYTNEKAVKHNVVVAWWNKHIHIHSQSRAMDEKMYRELGHGREV